MKLFMGYLVLGLSNGAPQTQVDADFFANSLLRNGFNQQDDRIIAPTDKTSPSAVAALAYMKAVSNDELCGIPSQIYLENILNGKSREVANAEATRFYINAFNGGARLVPGSACQAADIAWREAYISGRDPTFESAAAFMKSWPGVKQGSPCAISGLAYVNAIIDGKTHLEANRISMSSFANAFKNLAIQRKPLKDQACIDSTKAFAKAIPNNPDPANAAALTAFMDKIFSGSAAYDPVCFASLEGFIKAYASGEDLLTSNLLSARSFFRAFIEGSDISPDSPCAAATIAYANAVQKKPSAPNGAAMIAYITDAISKRERKIDPVCAAATLAYWDAYLEKKDEAHANKAAAIAYLETLDKHPEFDQTSACARATEAYMQEFELDK